MKSHINTSYRGNRWAALLFMLIILFIAENSIAWKPTTHVYLALQALDEILSVTDRLGNSKPYGTVPIYNVDYHNGVMGETVIGYYPVDASLLTALENHRDEFIAGVLGPDAYPDIVTGQTRIHVETPVYTNEWLEYLWDEAQEDDPEILAFVTGYLTHAAGDMFMHTFMNHFTGGPFSISGTPNGFKHYILEGYIGKRTPDLDENIFDLPVSNKVYDFIYDHLVDTRKNTYLYNNLYQVNNLSDAGTTQLASVPIIYSMLRDGLQNQIDFYDKTIADFDKVIADKRKIAEDCGEIVNPTCALLYTDMNIEIGKKAAFETSNFIQTEYLRAWVNDIDSGLKAWPSFNHQLAKAIVFSPDGINMELADSLANDFTNRHVLSMSGAPDGLGGTLIFIQTMKEIIFPQEIRDQIDEIKGHLLDQMLLATWGRTREQIEEEFKNPELFLDQVMALPDPLSERQPNSVTLTEVNRDILGITDIGFNNKNERFGPYVFPPAYNTITMVKLLIMSKEGIAQLRSDLGCSEDECQLVGENAMLGFIKSLDGDNGWHRAENVDWQPGPNEPQMVFASCGAYSKLFLNQIGETDICPPILVAPVITPESKVSSSPVTITMSHPENDVQIYYTVSEKDAPVIPSDDPAQSRSHLYSSPFQAAVPLDGNVRPFVYRAKAFKAGSISSDIAETEYTINAQLEDPKIFPNGGDFTGFVNVTISSPSGGTVFYTTNGTTPDFNSTRYTGQFQLKVGEYNVQAVVYKINFTQSNIIQADFNVYDGRTDRVAEIEFTPFSSGQFTTSLDVKILSRTQGSQVRYTIAKDGVPDNPTEQSTLFNEPFTLGLGNWFIRAKAFKDGMPPSDLDQINYNIVEPIGIVNNPIIEPNGGVFNNEVDITITTTTTPVTSGIRIFYTIDGTEVVVDPQLAGNYNNNGFTLRKSATVRTAAARTFFTFSGETSAEFELKCADPEINPANGSFTDSVEVVMNSLTNNAKIYYTTDGSEPSDESNLYSAPFYFKNSTTLKAKAYKNGYSPSNSTAANFNVQYSEIATISKQPINREATVGETVNFYVMYNGTPKPVIQWQFNNNNIEGENSDTLKLSNLVLENGGNYRSVITNASGTVISSEAILTVLPKPVAPVILTQPKNLIVNEGDSAVFTIETTGIPKPNYLWFRNGSPLIAQISEHLSFATINLSHAGRYQVQVSNPAGLLLSDPVNLTVNLATGVSSEGSEIPNKFQLSQNYPNPFNPTTTISFAIAKQVAVKISLFDILGREIAIVVDETLSPGKYKTVFDATGLSSGRYFYRIEAGDFVETKKLILMK